MSYKLQLQKGDKVIVWYDGKWIEGEVSIALKPKDWVGISTQHEFRYLHCVFQPNKCFDFLGSVQYRRTVIKKVS
jgi:hypothetical protein